ncbi:MAG: OadG family transporter subunit [Enterobacterales bacterium]|nr:OadG family transporter subunit [Enterobacterales bacterium]
MQSIAQDSYQAAFLMLIGMGFVFLFLTLLIVTIHYVIRPLGATQKSEMSTAKQTDEMVTTQVSAPVVAAISGAIRRYEQQHLSNT